MLDKHKDRDTIHFMDNTLKSNVADCNCSLMQDSYKRQYLACLSNFDTNEIADGYSIEEVEELIDFLTQVREELKFKNNMLLTPILYTGTIE